jgi:hypothetical protein
LVREYAGGVEAFVESTVKFNFEMSRGVLVTNTKLASGMRPGNMPIRHEQWKSRSAVPALWSIDLSLSAFFHAVQLQSPPTATVGIMMNYESWTFKLLRMRGVGRARLEKEMLEAEAADGG